jgi:hypothetical protein
MAMESAFARGTIALSIPTRLFLKLVAAACKKKIAMLTDLQIA